MHSKYYFETSLRKFEFISLQLREPICNYLPFWTLTVDLATSIFNGGQKILGRNEKPFQ